MFFASNSHYNRLLKNGEILILFSNFDIIFNQTRDCESLGELHVLQQTLAELDCAAQIQPSVRGQIDGINQAGAAYGNWVVFFKLN
jgi:hypothetical protein